MSFLHNFVGVVLLNWESDDGQSEFSYSLFNSCSIWKAWTIQLVRRWWTHRQGGEGESRGKSGSTHKTVTLHHTLTDKAALWIFTYAIIVFCTIVSCVKTRCTGVIINRGVCHIPSQTTRNEMFLSLVVTAIFKSCFIQVCIIMQDSIIYSVHSAIWQLWDAIREMLASNRTAARTTCVWPE